MTTGEPRPKSGHMIQSREINQDRSSLAEADDLDVDPQTGGVRLPDGASYGPAVFEPESMSLDEYPRTVEAPRFVRTN